MSENTIAIQQYIARLQAGDKEVRGQLIQMAYERLQRMARKMKRDYDRLNRWEQTDDILQNASLRLYEALSDVAIADERHFYRLAALQLRRELIDMCRHYHGPQGQGANHQTQMRVEQADSSAPPPAFEQAEVTTDPQQMQAWGDFHRTVEELPDREREVFDMLWYHDLTQEEAAEILGISSRQVKRIWRSAKLHLHDKLQGESPV